ncbi:serine threonine protein kinase CMGC group [Dipsacomyces acuminosporus]|nr:serine threonine protein kinase CMGC group [Dipsacomyces acuminosporus]
MSVLSFVTSFFRSRNNRVDPQHDISTAKLGFQSTDEPLPPPNDINDMRNPSKQNAKMADMAQRHKRAHKLQHAVHESIYGTTGSSRYHQQKAEPCDDRDGHYIVVPGRDFTPRFRIRRLLGQGTFGKVMECEDAQTGRLVAIKVIRAVPKYRDAAKIEIRVLQTLQRNDPANKYQCMHLNETLDHRNHVCMVFDLLGPSVFDFLKENEFRPFSLHHVQLFAEQLLRSVAFIHRLRLIHTDLKPENILLESGEYDIVPFGSSQSVKTRMLKSTNIRLIDFGSATFDSEYHSQVVSTRHYRAPEIILNLGWSFPCDMWSIGCIIIELLTGEALFQTHDNHEHLAMMEVVVGRAPSHIIRSVAPDLRSKFFRSDGSARYPSPEQPRQSQKGVRAMRPLGQIVSPSTNPIYANLHDLLNRLLQFDPRARITAEEACAHPFFRYRVGPDGRLASKPATISAVQSRLAPHAATGPTIAAHGLSHHVSYSSKGNAMAQQYHASVATASSAVAPLSLYTYASNPVPKPEQSHTNMYTATATSNSNTLAPPLPPPLPPPQQQQQQQQQQSYYYRDGAAVAKYPVAHREPIGSPLQPQLQRQSLHHQPGTTHSWQHAGPNARPVVPAALLNANVPSPNAVPVLSPLASASANYEAPLGRQERNDGGKRQAGVPIDSGYFPDIPSPAEYMSTGKGLPPTPSADSASNFAVPYQYTQTGNGGADNGSNNGPATPHGLSHPRQQHYSSNSSFSTAPAMSLSAKPSNPAPPAPHPIQVSVNLHHHHHHHQQQQQQQQQQQHPYGHYHQQQQRSLLSLATSGSHSSGQVLPNGPGRFPMDVNTTPTLTTATTATPTPGSSSAHLSGSHSIEGNMHSASSAILPLSTSGSHKLTGIINGSAPSRSLPSLALAHSTATIHAAGTNPCAPVDSKGDAGCDPARFTTAPVASPLSVGIAPQQDASGQQQKQLPLQLPPTPLPHQTHLGRGSYFSHLPSAHALLQSQVAPHPRPAEAAGQLDYARHSALRPPTDRPRY